LSFFAVIYAPEGKESPTMSSKQDQRVQEREARMAAVLRENLRRRKEQQQARGAKAVLPESVTDKEE